MKPSPITPFTNTSLIDADKARRLKEDIDLVSNLTSHNLKSPLNTILTYASELEERLSGHKLKEEQEWLGIIQQETLRMREMVAILFDYLSVEISSNAPRKAVDCNNVLSMVLHNLNNKIKNTHARITHDTLPIIQGREKYIASLFTHLIDNALTFHSTQPPVIHISAIPRGQYWEFRIQDNGIGIDEEFQDIIFILFQRLHSVDTYPGLGVGLAMCKKIIECAGGEIHVSSAPGKGSTFIFTLPAAS